MRVFIGSEPAQIRAERVLEYSINRHASIPVDITVMRNGQPGFDDWLQSNPTGFTMFRYAVPELCNFEGVAIYLDCDQLVLGDIAELASYHQPGRWVQHASSEGDAVSVIDCASVCELHWPAIRELKGGALKKWDMRRRMEAIVTRTIPDEWNSIDQLQSSTKLVHYSDLAAQPWQPTPERWAYYDHPDKAAVDLWNQFAKDINA